MAPLRGALLFMNTAKVLTRYEANLVLRYLKKKAWADVGHLAELTNRQDKTLVIQEATRLLSVITDAQRRKALNWLRVTRHRQHEARRKAKRSALLDADLVAMISRHQAMLSESRERVSFNQALRDLLSK